MRQIFTCVLVFSIALVFSCKDKSTNPPDNYPPGYQHDIPWPSLADSPWPMSHKNPQSTGRTNVVGPQSPNIKWSIHIPDGIFSGPVISSNGNLYFGTDSFDKFYCVDSSGNILFMKRTNSNMPLYGALLICKEGTIYVGSMDGNLYAFSPNGDIKWSYSTNGPIFQDVINIDLEGNIYFTSGDNNLYSLTANGELRWKINEGFALSSSAFTVDGKSLFIPGKQKNLYCYNTNGTLQWIFNTEGKISTSPLVDNQNNVYVIEESLPTKLLSIKSDGQKRWSYIIDTNNENKRPATCMDRYGNIFFWGTDTVDYWPAIYSVDYFGNYRWKYLISDFFLQPIVCDYEGTIYVGSTNGVKFYSITNEGKLKWELLLNGLQVDNTVTIDKDGTLYLGLHNGSNTEHTLIAIK